MQDDSTFMIKNRNIRDDSLVATYYYNKGSKQRPSIIMFGGSGGGDFFNNHIDFCKELVKLGYTVLTLTYFDYRNHSNLPKMLKNIPIEYVGTAMKWLEKHTETSNKIFAVIGLSRGSELALLSASYYHKISAVVALVPSSYVWGPYDLNRPVTGSAWTFEGQPIHGIDQSMLASYSPWWSIINDLEQVDNFFIPVEKMAANILLLSGKNDNIWPSTEMSNRIINRLRQKKYPHYYNHIAYDGDHYIFTRSWDDIVGFLIKHYPAN